MPTPLRRPPIRRNAGRQHRRLAGPDSGWAGFNSVGLPFAARPLAPLRYGAQNFAFRRHRGSSNQSRDSSTEAALNPDTAVG